MALQRNADLRAEWKHRLTEWKPEQLMFLDESAANEKTSDRKYGWAPIGAIASSHELLKYTEKWSILRVLNPPITRSFGTLRSIPSDPKI